MTPSVQQQNPPIQTNPKINEEVLEKFKQNFQFHLDHYLQYGEIEDD
jgi:hypothetical protein